MSLFYFRHHYLSIKRSKSLSGETFAFFLLTILIGSSLTISYDLLDTYAVALSSYLNLSEASYPLIVGVYLLVDLSLKLVFRRPLPKLKYYVLLHPNIRALTSQYLVTSLFGIIPYLFGISMLLIAFKTRSWLGTPEMLSVILWWFVNHFLGLSAQFSPNIRRACIAILLILLLLVFIFPDTVPPVCINPLVSASLLLISIFLSYHSVHRSMEQREIVEEGKELKIFDFLTVVNFKNPVFQLEWALIVGNKRTRSNLLFGLVSVLLLPFLIEESGNMSAIIFFITTGFFIIQHGVYSLGWEGSYFDFLVTNISPINFVRTRYLFYLGTCFLGLLLASIPVIIQGLSWVQLSMIFLYNIGVTIPLVLYRSTFNDAKIILSENSFMNYNGMMTGPIFVTSFLIMLSPLFIYGISATFLEEGAFWILGLLGVIGLLLFFPVTRLIAVKYYKKKYHLSQSFKG